MDLQPPRKKAATDRPFRDTRRAGVYLYFNNYISLLVGPVFFTDRALQPGRAGHMWTTQLDVDIPLRRLHK